MIDAYSKALFLGYFNPYIVRKEIESGRIYFERSSAACCLE